MNESKEERSRRKARERKQRQREKKIKSEEKEAEKWAALGAQPISFIAYKGTIADLALIRELGGFEGDEADEEAITLILHNVAALARRDRHAFDRFTAIPSRSGDADA